MMTVRHSAIVLLLCCVHLHAQDMRPFTARVVDATNMEALMFVTVRLENPELKVITDENGHFRMEMPSARLPERYVLLISYIGYQPMRFRVPRRVGTRMHTIKLQRTNFDLGEPPVMRYRKNGRPAN